MGKPLEVLIIFFDDFYDVGLGCASTIALALILPGLSNKVRSPSPNVSATPIGQWGVFNHEKVTI